MASATLKQIRRFSAGSFHLFQGLFDLTLPQTCRICGVRSSAAVCDGCLAGLPKTTGSLCSRCGKACQRNVDHCRDCAGKRLHFVQARSGGPYAGTLKEAIHQLKYKNARTIAPRLAAFVAGAVRENIELIEAIAFVPLAPRKEAVRGYNQSRLIAQELSVLFDRPLYTGLVKNESTAEQNKLGLAERVKNVRGAFTARGAVPKRVLLVDDVYTTGSTVNECALALKRAGASEIFVVTVARTPLEGR